MIVIREQSGKTATYVTDYIADTEEELEELPISPQCAKGSTCLCVENNSLYLLDGTNHWVRI
jgi:hypothetical protein